MNGATLLQGALVGARDAAIASKAPAGIRLLLDPTLSTFTAAGQVDATKSLACNRWVPTSIPPVYTEGTVNTFPGAMPANIVGTVTQNFPYPATVTNLVPAWNPNFNPLLLQVPCLVVEENPATGRRPRPVAGSFFRPRQHPGSGPSVSARRSGSGAAPSTRSSAPW